MPTESRQCEHPCAPALSPATQMHHRPGNHVIHPTSRHIPAAFHRGLQQNRPFVGVTGLVVLALLVSQFEACCGSFRGVAWWAGRGRLVKYQGSAFVDARAGSRSCMCRPSFLLTIQGAGLRRLLLTLRTRFFSLHVHAVETAADGGTWYHDELDDAP